MAFSAFKKIGACSTILYLTGHVLPNNLETRAFPGKRIWLEGTIYACFSVCPQRAEAKRATSMEIAVASALETVTIKTAISATASVKTAILSKLDAPALAPSWCHLFPFGYGLDYFQSRTGQHRGTHTGHGQYRMPESSV